MKRFRLEQFFKNNWSYLLVILIIVIAIQTVWMFRMQRKLYQREGNSHTNLTFGSIDNSSKKHDGLSLFPKDPFDDDFFNNTFDPNTWDPFREMQNMQDRIDSMFGGAFGRFSQSPRFGDIFDSSGFTPKIDIREEDDRIIIKIDLPGADTSNVDVTCEEQELTISGTIDKLQEDSQGGSLLRRERRSGHFSRTITLPAPVQAEKVESKIDKGVMTITIPKAKQ
jgi:HSP20 family protein